MVKPHLQAISMRGTLNLQARPNLFLFFSCVPKRSPTAKGGGRDVARADP
jgi:hypothetical protein